METAIEVRGLTKTYHARGGRHVAVDQLSMDVPRGGVHALLGEDGSGKTTILRIIAGLDRADEGTVRVLGQPVPSRLGRAIHDVGVVLDPPAFFEGFSGAQNLMLLARAAGVPKAEAFNVLEQTGLPAHVGDHVRTYSSGRMQRLALAAALLKDPEILILDEPTNELDPPAAEALQQLIRERGRAGQTVLITSRRLSEVEPVADTVTIVHHGQAVIDGTIDEIEQARGDLLEVGVAFAPQVAAQLRKTGLKVAQTEGDLLLISDPPDPAMITKYLASKRVYVFHLRLRPAKFEEVFLGLADPVERIHRPTGPAEPEEEPEEEDDPVEPEESVVPPRPANPSEREPRPTAGGGRNRGARP